jgi:5'-3' exonuclease
MKAAFTHQFCCIEFEEFWLGFMYMYVVWVSQAGTEADVEKYSKRTVKVTKQHNEDCRKLLRLMGVPVVEVCTYSTS